MDRLKTLVIGALLAALLLAACGGNDETPPLTVGDYASGADRMRAKARPTLTASATASTPR